MMLIHPTNAKYLALNNFASCLYIPLILGWLYMTGSLYDVGHFKDTNLQWILMSGEILKYILFNQYSVKDARRQESKKFKVQTLIKAALTMLALLASFHIVAVLFGAPFFSKQQETFTFALTMCILTVLPCCLYLGADKAVYLMLSLTCMPANKENDWQFLANIQITCLMAWLGAVVVPLDWNRPFQVWPIPCILGALLGAFISNLFLLVTYLWQSRLKKKHLKVEC